MTTFAIMQARIADEMQRPDLTSQIQNAIKTAIEDLKGDRFARINVGALTCNTVANQPWYSLATDFLDENGNALPTGTTLIEIDGAVVNYNQWFQPMTPKAISWIDTYQIPTYTGQPFYYAWQGERLRFAPTANGVYNVVIRGHLELPAPVNAADTSNWFTVGEKLVRGTAKAILARDVLQDMEQMQMAMMSAGEARQALDRQTAARSTQRLQAWGY